MDIHTLARHIEALVFASDTPLTPEKIISCCNRIFEDSPEKQQIINALDLIHEKYSDPSFPFSLKKSGGGYQFLTKKEFHETIMQLNEDRQTKKLTPAAMETLAIIAYKQPVTRMEIEMIRGVNADYALTKLLDKELIIIVGRREDTVGKPLLYATSTRFMDYLGINELSDLPSITEFTLPTNEARYADDAHEKTEDLETSTDQSLINSSVFRS